MTEALRLYFVVLALGFPDVELGLSGAVFVALIGSLLTAVPLSPAGLGIVEAGVVGVLTVAYGVPLPEATAIALLDRVISVFSVIVFGSIAYLFSTKPRGPGPDPAARRRPSHRSMRAQVVTRRSGSGRDRAPDESTSRGAPTRAAPAPRPTPPHRPAASPSVDRAASVPTGDTGALRAPSR